MYNNFIPTVWSTKLQTERDRVCVAANLCNRDFEGDIKKVGDSVKINGVKRPTVQQYKKGQTIITPEDLSDQSTNLKIERSDYFAFGVDDVDQAQASGNLMNTQMQEAAAAMAESADSYIYGKYGDAGKVIDCSNLTSANTFSKLMEAFQALWAANVPGNEPISIEASPGLMGKILLAKLSKGTPNDDTIKNGFQGQVDRLLNSKLYLSNGIYNDGTYDYCFVRTAKAIAFADQLSKTEAYRPENAFSDAVKGLHLYGAKVVRPKELVVLKSSYAAETTI